jgi:predicted nuclease of predicted toxin-antitoxin system
VNIVLDMNLSPEWIPFLERPGWTIRRWNEVGRPQADDSDIADWAAQNGYAVMTQDLDFSDILYMTQAVSPSVILLRHSNEHSSDFRVFVRRCLLEMEKQLQKPSLLVVSRHHARWRPLPIGSDANE